MWCPTEVDTKTLKYKSGKWGYCADGCPEDSDGYRLKSFISLCHVTSVQSNRPPAEEEMMMRIMLAVEGMLAQMNKVVRQASQYNGGGWSVSTS